MLRALVTMSTFVLVSSGCSGGPEQINSGESAQLGQFTNEEILAESRTLLAKLEVERELIVRLEDRVGQLLEHRDFKTATESTGVGAVLAVRGGGGGFIVRSGGTRGFASFADGREGVPITTSGVIYGAVIGGGATVGIVLLAGIESDVALQDRYSVTAHGGEAGQSSYWFVRGKATRGGHEAWFTGSGTGFGGSAGWGHTDILFAPEDAVPE